VVVCTPTTEVSYRIDRRQRLETDTLKQAISHNSETLRPPLFGKYTWKLDGALPGKHTRKLYDSLDRQQAAVLVQARTGHNHLIAYRARIRAAESALCSCGKGADTVQHLLLWCPIWKEQREALEKKAVRRWGDMSFLRGRYSNHRRWTSGLPMDGPRDKWKPDMDMVKATINFLIQTGRMRPQEGWRENEAN